MKIFRSLAIITMTLISTSSYTMGGHYGGADSWVLVALCCCQAVCEQCKECKDTCGDCIKKALSMDQRPTATRSMR